jgi:hypothetical protein
VFFEMPFRHPDNDDPVDDGPLSLEPHEDDEPSHRPPSPASGDAVCPNCGKPREDVHALVCLHCGYDMKTLRVVRTQTGEVEVSDEEDEEAADKGPPLADGMGPQWLPLAVLIPCAAIMLFAYFAGARGLFPALDPAAESVAFGERLVGLGRFLVRIGLLTGCGFAAIWILAWMLGRRLGDPRQAAMRVLTMIVSMRLIALIDLASRQTEWMLETVLQAGAFLGLAFLLFGLRPREVVTWGLLMIAVFGSFWIVSWLGMWAMA